ncbi:DUF3365 domain-containing protein [Formosa sediminum]|uniref:DUF3365 domain-containing protein n=1 Tax=Formosa sediminum TaxID=2594004 RepID=A0A516GSV4_9FLAO|nr:DUF3365 domain-containing protein [Formosa sediminum]QDO94603.1 DUF3365 domain-containing protein [Formosa sediminum]
MKNSFTVLLLAMLLVGCNFSKKKNTTELASSNLSQSEHPGKKLMETNCYVCHSPTADEYNRNGPPMVAIKRRYITNNTTKEDFIQAMLTWTNQPSKDKALMYGAVQRYGVMPKLVYPEETITQIADYMYRFDIEQPEWFEDHYQQQNRQGLQPGMGMKQKQQSYRNNQTLTPKARGLNYVSTTQNVLGKNLIEAIEKQGLLEALSFCNEKAYPLTDSMAAKHNASIKRVTDKPRNKSNMVSPEELEYIKIFKTLNTNNVQSEPIIITQENQVKFYYPITTNTMCLQCHGKPNETLKANTLHKIKQLYPNDKAIGYTENEVRGIWSVTFNK